MKILITGGAGFIGTHLRAKLVANGHSVRILDNLHPQVHGLNPADNYYDCDFNRGDVRDLVTVATAMKDIDLVYHLAAETGVGQSQYEIERYISTNTLGTAVVLQAAVGAGVQQFVLTSSRAVYGEGMHACPKCGSKFVPNSRKADDLERGNWEISCTSCGEEALPLPMTESHPLKPISIYGLTKLQQEQVAGQVQKVHTMAVTNLRLFNVFGPGQSLNNPYVGVLGTFFRKIRSKTPLDIYEDGKMRRDFVYVADVVNTLTAVAMNKNTYNKTLNVGTGVPITLEQAAREMFEILGGEPKLKLTGKFRIGDIHHAVSDTSRLKNVINYIPDTSFREGLRSFTNWALNQKFDADNIDDAAEQQLKDRNLLGQAQK